MNVAIFVEGQTEQIFVRELLNNYFRQNKIDIDEQKFSKNLNLMSFKTSNENNNRFKHQCLIFDCTNDKVLSKIKDNYIKMHNRGWDVFFGLRDLKSREYDLNGEIIIDEIKKHIKSFDKDNIIFFHFAKMVIEAWFLAEYNFFEKIDRSLTVEEISRITKQNLSNIDPETDITNPIKFLRIIYREKGGKTYDKHKYQINEIVYNLDWAYLCVGVKEEGKISFFFNFLDDLEKVLC